MTVDANDSSKVTYSVKELLAEIKTMVAQLSGQLSGKADQSAVDTLTFRTEAQDKRLDKHELQIAGLKERETEKIAHAEKTVQERIDFKRWRLPIILGATYTLVSPFLWLLASKVLG